jgi:RNA polymerase sigma-70 factor (ECF subfamily)
VDDRRLRDLAASGDARAVRALVDRTSRVVEARVARALTRRAEGRDIHGELLDVVQDVYVALFEDDAKVLRAWDPERGASLANFIGLIAERTAATMLRTKKTDPYRDSPEDWEQLEARLDSASFEGGVVSRDFGARLLELLRAELSPRGMELFLRLFVEGEDPASVAAALEMNRDAVYAWKSRLQKIIQDRIRRLDPSSGAIAVAERNP